MSILRLVAIAPLAMFIVFGTVQAGTPEGKPVADTTPEPSAKVLARLLKEWPKDLTIGFTRSSGGLPPYVTHWEVDAKGVGTFERISYERTTQKKDIWPVKFDRADLEAMLVPLCDIDIEKLLRPVPDSPVQFIGVTAGSRSVSINTFALTGPELDLAQHKVFTAMEKLLTQAENAKPAQPAPPAR